MLSDIDLPHLAPRREPLEVRWHGQLPRRALQAPAHPARSHHGFPPPPWLDTGPTNQPFDFSGRIQRLLEDIARRCEFFAHLRVPEILVSALQARNGHAHGLQARVTPLRFAQGQLTRRRRGGAFQVQRFFLDDQEFLYVLTFSLPRFLNQDFDDKLVTIFHELYHISPRFDGDLRRHQGRCHLHTHSQKKYDRHMAELARAYLAAQPDPGLLSFLRLDFQQLTQRHGTVESTVIPRPRMIPVPS